MDSSTLRDAVTQFLALEAKLLDECRFDEWYDLLDDDLVYEAPLRLAGRSRDKEIIAGAYRFRDTKKMIRTRIDRLHTGLAFAENPPSRTVRSVSSICISQDEGPLIAGVSSALIVYRHRANDPLGDTIHARRNDRLRLGTAGLRLTSRSIILSEVSMSTANFGIFL